RRAACCPRFASLFWTLTRAEEDSGWPTEHLQLTISGRPLRSPRTSKSATIELKCQIFRIVVKTYMVNRKPPFGYSGRLPECPLRALACLQAWLRGCGLHFHTSK